MNNPQQPVTQPIAPQPTYKPAPQQYIPLPPQYAQPVVNAKPATITSSTGKLLKQVKRVAKLALLIVFAVIFTIVAILAIRLLSKLDTLNSQPEIEAFSSNEYNIVFLNNNLFYFCKLENINSEYVKCNEPYYLVRKKETAEDGKSEEKIYVRKPSEEEVYQPDGALYIFKSNIVYIAKVGTDSQVFSVIKQDD